MSARAASILLLVGALGAIVLTAYAVAFFLALAVALGLVSEELLEVPGPDGTRDARSRNR